VVGGFGSGSQHSARAADAWTCKGGPNLSYMAADAVATPPEARSAMPSTQAVAGTEKLSSRRVLMGRDSTTAQATEMRSSGATTLDRLVLWWVSRG
jgi:hypothetical protein